MSEVDIGHLRAWVGRSSEQESLVTGWQAEALAATLDRDDAPPRAGDALPPAWHWLYFPEAVKLSATGPDGHARRGGFMPPVPLPRRMWAADHMRLHAPLRVGERIRRVSTVSDVSLREGASGPLVLVTVRHEVAGAAGPALSEEHTTIYRGRGAAGGRARPAPATARWRRRLQPSPVLLFRFSALTMNSHRIHYDRDWATREEGYPGLLVHGPLTAVLLLDLFRREQPAAQVRGVSVRALAPLCDGAPLTLEGAPGEAPGTALLWALDAEGRLAMRMELEHAAG